MKGRFIAILVILAIILVAGGCKGKAGDSKGQKSATQGVADNGNNGYGPDNQLIKEQFQALWLTVHGTKNTGTNWRLINTEVGAVRTDTNTKTSTVNIKFTYAPGNKPQRTKGADFIFKEVDGLWKIDATTAKYPITPN